MKKITFKGNPLTLVGRCAREGMEAPDFKITSQDMKEVGLRDFKGAIKIFTTFPSLDTPVCDLQVKEFNKRAAGFSADVVIVGISKDLPFAQKRFCDTFKIDKLEVYSDYKTGSFGINYGVLIKELNLLARAIFIVDKGDIIRYVQIAPELANAPLYEEALARLEEVLATPVPAGSKIPALRCVPCEGDVSALPEERAEALMAQARGWQLIDGKKLAKEFKFGGFEDAKYFLDLLSIIASEQGHHPNFTLIYNRLKVILTTHAAGGLTDNDFVMAKIIDDVALNSAEL